MIRAGFTIDNPITKARTIVLKSDAETNGEGWLLEHHNVPHSSPDIPEHFHLTWTETFEIIQGEAFYKLDGVQRTASAGDIVVVHPRQTHIHPWNAGETELVYQQSDVFDPPSVQAVQDVLGVFATLTGLAREGKVNQQGEPKNPLQLAATLKTLNKHGGYDAKLPKWAQDLLAATLGSLAEALGYKGVYPQFVNEKQR
jgi:mannose-6-phosphate isomerase-like protein (cupin superfamily)